MWRMSIILCLCLASAAQAQTAPSASEIAGYDGLHRAAQDGDIPAIRQLVAKGADVNALEDGVYDVLTITAVANDPQMVSLALDLGNRPDLVTSVYDGTALIAAAHLGHHEVVRQLIEGGAPLDHVNNLGWTALIEAVILGDGGPDHVRTVQYLVEGGADLNIPDRDGVTALQHAEGRHYRAIAEIIAAGGE